ncbi:LysM repeat protein [Scopulibacillus daqui]|uniref:LysM repeat protein n=1 Tax=Scopulibacillus daqui TaxID=1469162 RepID=A0ABS2PX64_9BACL|nr:LysM peptidoglycan-binding domain-containing protein [Scopulibacillus daqui]MBM7644622.1 LysM repeat protein [Scopulibacillus daqui]
MKKRAASKRFIPAAVLATGIIFSANGAGHAATGSEILSYGNQFLGKPYIYGASYGQTQSFDCSSFTKTIFAHFGIDIPRVSSAQATVGVPVSKSNLQVGDLLFYDTDGDGVINHVGIYAGDGQMLDAEPTYGVRYTSAFSNAYWNKYFVTARRVLGESGSANPPGSSTPAPPANNGSSSHSSGSFYTVKPGDSLWKIASSHGMSVAQLKSANGLASDLIYAGQKLKLSGSASSSGGSNSGGSSGNQASSGGTYVVKSGDSLWKIAANHGMSVSKLKSINGLSSDIIYPGQKLKLSGSASSSGGSNSGGSSGNQASSGGTYVVKPGDSLWKIAVNHGMSLSSLKSINGLKSDVIYPGQKLKLSGHASTSNTSSSKHSSKKPASSFYIVKKGDSLWDIALLNDTSVNKLMKANHLSSIVIYPGQKLAIPQ